MTIASLRRSLWVHSLLWLVLAALVIDVGRLAPVRLDLTRSGRFSLADASGEIVGQLDKPLVVRVWFTERLDPPYHAHRTALLDLLAALDAASPYGIEVVARDPGDDPEQRAAAAADGIRALPYTFRSADRMETRSVYLGAALLYGDKRIAIDALPSIEQMEYNVVRAIDALVTEDDDRPTIGWWTGHGEPEPTMAPADSPLQELWKRLGSRAVVRIVEGPIPEDVDALVLVAPRSGVPPADLASLDQFVMRGGRVLLFVSSFAPDFGRMSPVEVEHGLYAWLGHLGVKVGRDLLLDRAHAERLSLPIGARWVSVVHPLALVTTELDRAYLPVRNLPRLVLPFASTVTPAEILPEGVEAEVWTTTDGDASAIKGLRTLDPGPLLRGKLSSEVIGPHPVVVALSGSFPSFYTERAPPPGTPALVLRSAPTRLVVVGSADAIANNLDFALNAVDWLNEDVRLMGLRSKWLGDPQLPAPSRGAALRAKVLMIGLPLGLIAGMGLWVGRRR